MSERDFDELSAADALHALTPDAERALRDALAGDPALRARHDADQRTAALLAETVAEVVPPPSVRDALLARIAVTPQDGADAGAPDAADAPASSDPTSGADSSPDPGTPTRRGGWGPRAWFALAAGLVLILGIGGAVAVVSQQITPPASVVALERIQDAPDAQSAAASVDGGGEATLHWSASLGEAVLVSDDLPEISDDRTYELWWLRNGEPISAGVFATDDGQATALLEGEMQAGDAVAITIEPEGGAPGGIPTGSPIVAIAT